MADFFSESFFELWLEKAVPKIPELREYLELEEAYLVGNIKPNSAVLDIGCGFGRHLELLLSFSDLVVGIDKSLYMLDKAATRIRARNLCLATQHARKLDIIDDAFDYVICMTNTFGNFGGYQKEALGEMKRVCKNDGRIIVSVYSQDSVEPRRRSYEEVGLKDIRIEGNAITTEEGLFSECFTRDRLEKMFQASGLESNIYRLNSVSYLCKAVK